MVLYPRPQDFFPIKNGKSPRDDVDGAFQWVVREQIAPPRRRPLGFVRHAKDVCREARGQKAADVTSDVKYIRKSLCTSPNSVF